MNLPKYQKYLLIGVAFIGLIILAQKLGITAAINQFLQQSLEWIAGLGVWGMAIFIIIYILATLLLIPGSVLTLGAGAVFGLIQGSILVSVGSTLGATLAFIVGRYFARGWVVKQIDKYPKFKAIDHIVAQDGWKIIGLTRLSPLFPFIFLNYAFAVTNVSLKDYVLASWACMLPGTVMYVYIGSLAKNVATLGANNSQGGVFQLVLQIIGFIATVAVTVYVTKMAQKALNNQIVQDQEKDLVTHELE